MGLSAKNGDLIENAVGHFGLGQQRQGFHALMADQRDDVGINAETGSCLGNIVSNDHVQMLFIQLLLGVFQKMLRFGGKAAKSRAPNGARLFIPPDYSRLSAELRRIFRVLVLSNSR